ncbi:MAG: GNAT family N-acetyltransferase [Solirubrobacteraceae bacterium]
MGAVTVQRIRAAELDDLPALRRVYRSSSLSVERFREILLANPETLELSGQAVIEGRTRVAVGTNGEILGFITGLSLRESVLELEDLFVDPRWMRRGVARRLVEDLAAAARRDRVTVIEVTANPAAVAFYRSVGFVHLHDTETRFGPAPRMQLLLAPAPAAPRSSAVSRFPRSRRGC